jgi:hypothetical protein
MSDEVTIRKQLGDAPVWSERARELEDALIQSVNERLRTEAAAEAARLKPAGSYAVEQPAPQEVVEEPTPAPMKLSATFAGYETAIANAERAPARHGFADRLAGTLALFDGIQPHETITRDPEARLERADVVYDALVQRHGADQADEIINAWKQALTTLGLTSLVRARGLDTSLDCVEHLGQQWLRRSRSSGA